MWELRVANPLGELSPRKFLMLAAVMIAAILAFIFTTAPTAHAADAEWKGDSIMYGGNQYDPIADAKEGDSHGITPGSKIYAYVEPATPGSANTKPKGHLIYFTPGSDPPKATSATYATFDFEDPNYTNQSGTKSISLTTQAESDNPGTTSCNIKGIGWMVCPVSNFLAQAMDWLFGVLASFLVTGPVQTNPDNSLFRAWSIMRNFANAAFVIGFLIIIYSQLTNLGLSSYGIKRMLPRLIIAAILVNISYWVCAIAIDLSNIAGYSLQDIFMGIREDLVGNEANSQATSWESVTTAALSGTTLAVAGGMSLVAIGSVGGAIYMLLPVLVGVLVAALVAILIMAARQALITILVIIAPLAFVAYLLPNTEKYFEKWQKLFTTMLMMFPIFAVLFGGAQLAGSAIIQNASSIVILILGMAVQIAPLVILPFLLKFSGSLLGQIAGMANNKSKGLVDRTRNFAQERADLRKSQVLANPNLRRRNLLGNMVQRQDTNRREREGWKQANEAEADARWANTSKYSAIQQASMRSALSKSVGERHAETAFEQSKHTNHVVQGLELQAREAKLHLDSASAHVEANWEEIKAGNHRSIVTPENLSSSALANFVTSRDQMTSRIQEASREDVLTELRQKSAERLQKQDITETLLSNQVLSDGQRALDYAAGIGGQAAAETALAGAVAAHRKDFEDKVGEKTQLMRHFNLSSGQRQELALGDSVVAHDSRGHTYTFSSTDEHAREAAIEDQLKTGSYAQIKEIIAASGKRTLADGTEIVGKTHEFAATISQAVPKNGIPGKAVFFGTKTINDIAQGNFLGEESITESIIYNINEGKVKSDVLTTMDADAIANMFKVGLDPATLTHSYFDGKTAAEKQLFQDRVLAMQHTAHEIMDDPLMNRGASQKAREVLERNKLPPSTPPTPPAVP